MRAKFRPNFGELEEAFVEAIVPFGGRLWDRQVDSERLFLRVVYPQVQGVLPGDRFQRGVALRVDGESIQVHPYLFRLSRRNGAILAWAIRSSEVRRVKSRSSAARVARVVDELREVIHACSDELILHNAAEHLRSAAEIEVNLVLQLMPMMAQLPQRQLAGLLDCITTRFEAQRRRTLYGLMNAVTSVARETRDPETRWRLEALGGDLLIAPCSIGLSCGSMATA